MKKVLFGSVVLFANLVYANDFVKSVDGYIRAGFQNDDKSNQDISLGGKLHIETKSYYGILGGVSFYTTNVIGNQNDGAGNPFFDSDNNSYSIVGEAYFQANFKKSSLKVGRQEIDTPFADTDDIGMVPNTFAAAILTSNYFDDTTIVLGHIEKMAGVDAPKPEKFTDINGDNGVQVFSITYEGIKGLTTSAWYYNLNDFRIDGIFYVDANYESKIGDFTYDLGAQFANQSHKDSDDAKVFGLSGSLSYEKLGLTVTVAYNKSSDNAADNGFGGGPFFTSAEFLTIADAGKDADAILGSLEWDASAVGLPDIGVSFSKLLLEDDKDIDSNEYDFGLSYSFSDKLGVDLIYSYVDDDINSDNYKNTRVFINYNF